MADVNVNIGPNTPSLSWTDATLQNSWVNFAGGYEVAQYRKIGDLVEIRGLIKDGTLTNGTVIFTLPIGFRPVNRHIMTTQANGDDLSRLDIAIDGTIVINSTAANAFLSLSGISFSIS